MRKLYTLLFALFAALIFFEPVQVKASHVMGSDITWKCIGKDSFVVTVTAYRNCKGIDLSATPISYKSACGGANVSAGGEMSGGEDITPVCKKSCTQCTSSGCEFNFGIQQYQITTIIDLSKINCCEFTISWEQCCRNADITTGASGQNYYVDAKLNKCTKPCDNSPYFTNPPIAIYCVNQCIVINPGVNDEDVDANGQADSLIYKFVDPMSGAGSAIPYNDGYSKEAPLKYFGYPDRTKAFDPPKCFGFHLDPQTGDIQFKAVQEDITVMAIGVEEWRADSTGKKVKIGEIRRDLQIAIIECPDNRSPIISGINGGNQITMDFCAGQNKCFTIHSFDVDDKDTVTMTSNVKQTIPNATWEVESGKRFPKGTFCWTPSNADVRSYPWRFVVTGVDDACPVNARASRSFGIKVNASPEATYSATVGQCGLVTFKAFPGKITAISKYEWSGSMGKNAGRLKAEGNPITVKYTKPGTYIYNLTVTSVNGCRTVYTDSVKIPPYVWLDLGPDTIVCLNTTMNIKVKRYLGKADYLYEWSTNPGVWTKDKTQLDNVKITKNTTIWVKVKDNNGNGCDNYDSLVITAQVQPKPNLGPDRKECSIKGKFVELDASTGLAKMKSYKWYKRETSGNDISLREDAIGKLQVKDAGKYWVLVTDTIGCTGVDTINMFFNPVIDVEKNTFKACHMDSITLKGGTTSDSATWKWEDTRYIHLGLAPVSTEPTYRTQARGITTGIFQVLYKVTVTQKMNGITCTDVDTVTLRVYQKPKVKAGKLSPQCVDNAQYNLNQVISSPNGGWWTYSNKSNDVITGNIVSPKILGVGNHYLFYWYKDPVSECPNYDSTLLRVDTLPAVFAGNDTFICEENGAMLLGQIHNLSPQQGGQWIMQDPNQKGLSGGLNPSFDPKLSGYGPFNLIYRFENKTSARCSNQDTITITVYPKLIVDAGELEPVCSIIEDITLEGTPQGGEWRVESADTTILTYDATEGKYHFSPKKAGAGEYKLWYIASHPGGRCPQIDSTFLTVNAAPDVKLSTADGKTSYCITDGLIQLNGTPVGPGGSYYAPKGLVGTSFDPEIAGLGKHTIQYKYIDIETDCEDTKTITIEITDTAWVEIQPAAKLCRGADYDMEVKTSNAGNFVWRRVDATGELVPGQ
ncbi:MAG: hypothetical protein ACXWDO_02375, partial [Bacteroidia bacterium]